MMPSSSIGRWRWFGRGVGRLLLALWLGVGVAGVAWAQTPPTNGFIEIAPDPPTAQQPATVTVALYSTVGLVTGPPAITLSGTSAAGQTFAVTLPQQTSARFDVYGGQVTFPAGGRWTLTVAEFPTLPGVARSVEVTGAPAPPPPPSIPASTHTGAIVLDRGAGAVYRTGEPINVAFSLNPPAPVIVTDSGGIGPDVVVYSSGAPMAGGTFGGTAQFPGEHTLVVEAIVGDREVVVASVGYTVVAPTLAIAVDRAATGGFYRLGESVGVTFSVDPPAVVRVIDTSPLGGRVVVYDPGQPVGRGGFTGAASTPGVHTLTLEVLLDGQVIAATTTIYSVQ